MPVDWDDLLIGFEYVNAGPTGDHEVFLCKETGKLHWHSEYGDNEEELPDDIDGDGKYLRLPDKRDLDLGKPLVLAFAQDFLPDDFDEVREIFSRKGAYANFKALLQRRNALDRWHDFENKATEQALKGWCEDNEIMIAKSETK